jgi:ABC-type proline/glycine betaine transport system ATPase subunit
MVGRTSFIIAHRLSTIKNVTRIMVVADGSIAQSGTHTELVRQPGHYQQLYRSQFEALMRGAISPDVIHKGIWQKECSAAARQARRKPFRRFQPVSGQP